jgi:imidazole glycerol-phosphate synthase subunit HisF
MLRTRVIPCLLLRHLGLVKTVKFKDPTYLGDPINIVKIFNDKEVDELTFLDITATTENTSPPFDLLAKITTECFMPLGYGGGIRHIQDIEKILNLGVEKIVINSYSVENPSFIKDAADLAGSQTVVASIDVKKNKSNRYEVYTHSAQKATGLDPVKHAIEMEKMGAGEILLTSIDRDGTIQGYDLELVGQVSKAVGIPVVACGGAAAVKHLVEVVKVGGASAAAAGSMFVFQGPLRAVLISYPSQQELRAAFDA